MRCGSLRHWFEWVCVSSINELASTTPLNQLNEEKENEASYKYWAFVLNQIWTRGQLWASSHFAQSSDRTQKKESKNCKRLPIFPRSIWFVLFDIVQKARRITNRWNRRRTSNEKKRNAAYIHYSPIRRILSIIRALHTRGHNKFKYRNEQKPSRLRCHFLIWLSVGPAKKRNLFLLFR